MHFERFATHGPNGIAVSRLDPGRALSRSQAAACGFLFAWTWLNDADGLDIVDPSNPIQTRDDMDVEKVNTFENLLRSFEHGAGQCHDGSWDAALKCNIVQLYLMLLSPHLRWFHAEQHRDELLQYALSWSGVRSMHVLDIFGFSRTMSLLCSHGMQWDSNGLTR